MYLREATNTSDPLETARLLCLRGEYGQAREIVEGVIARQPGSRAAYDLLDQIAEKQRFASVQAGHGFDLGSALGGAWGWLLKAGGVICWFGALYSLHPLVFPDRVTRHPQPGQVVIEPNGNSTHDAMPAPLRVLLCIGLSGAGAGLWAASQRFAED